MAHSLPSHLGLDDFDAAFFTDNPSVFHAFVLTTVALIVFGRTKNLCTEKTITFRFKRPIINGFRFFLFPRATIYEFAPVMPVRAEWPGTVWDSLVWQRNHKEFPWIFPI
jgi:hypothetical protein